MKPFQERVVEEKKELDEKIEKLRTFVIGKTYDTLPREEQVRLTQQLEFMRRYSEILGERIENFT